MFLVFSLIVALVSAIEVRFKGDISLNMKIYDKSMKLPYDNVSKEIIAEEEGGDDTVVKMKAKDNENEDSSREIRSIQKRGKHKRLKMVTAAAEAVECVYQYPTRSQMEAMLSNMMNQLTKIYVKVREFVHGSAGVVEGVLTDLGEVRRTGEKRFRVVSSTNQSHFDDVYANMTKQYRNLYNRITYVVPRTTNPCACQRDLQSIWQHLINSSTSYLRSAVTRSVSHFVKHKPLSKRKLWAVNQLVEAELAKFKSSQLDVLCDQFQLCFNELL